MKNYRLSLFLSLCNHIVQENVDQFKASNNEAMEKIESERAQDKENFLTEINSLKEATEGLKKGFEESNEIANEKFEQSEQKFETQVAATEEAKQQINDLRVKSDENEKKLDEFKSEMLGIIETMKEEHIQSSKDVKESITAEAVKVLNILSETKMELKTDQENIMKVVTEDRESVESKTSQTNETMASLNRDIQSKLNENMNVLLER